MQRILSTYRYVKQPLSSMLLSEIARAGVSSVEVFCAPSHFSYRTPLAIRDLADALGEYGLRLHALHSPTERDFAPGRESGIPVSISDTERIRRVDAVDEVKRALEVAERIPFGILVQHLGHGHQTADPRTIDAAFSSLEHLVIFAKERGVTIALENTPNELGSPESLRLFVKETRLHDLKFCLDFGHAHMQEGVEKSFDAMHERIVSMHIHDNHGERDEHLLPHEGNIDWRMALGLLARGPQLIPMVVELKEQSAGAPTLSQIGAAFDSLEKDIEDAGARAAQA
jgi:sugar phosphate isomerase/epimerase